MLSMILNFLGGSVLKSGIEAYRERLAAMTAQDKLAVDLAVKEIEAEIEARKQASAIVIAEQGWWPTAIIRPLFAYPLIIYWGKVILYDKVLGWGSTDPLTGMIGEWAGWIIVAYFGGRTAEKIARLFKR